MCGLNWPLPLLRAYRACPVRLSHIDCSVRSNIDARQQHLRDGLVDARRRQQVLLATTTESLPPNSIIESSEQGSIEIEPFFRPPMPLTSAAAVVYLPFPGMTARGAYVGAEGAAARARVAGEGERWRELRGHGAPARAHSCRHGGGREDRQQQEKRA